MLRNKAPLKAKPNPPDVNVEKARLEDVGGIMSVAAAAGNSTEDPEKGFLIDDYQKNRDLYRQGFREAAAESEFFYVIKNADNKVLGFLLAYSKEQWLRYENTWLTDTHWKTGFDKKALNNFVLLEKIAVAPDLRGSGLGSIMSKRFRQDAKDRGIHDMFSETIIAPKPNFAAMAFAVKQRYALAGIRYEEFEGKILSNIVYHKSF